MAGEYRAAVGVVTGSNRRPMLVRGVSLYEHAAFDRC